MAETEKGKKIVPVKPYDRVVDGQTVHVPRHDRSTPRNSHGAAKTKS
jgi:hypothetical protein